MKSKNYLDKILKSLFALILCIGVFANKQVVFAKEINDNIIFSENFDGEEISDLVELGNGSEVVAVNENKVLHILDTDTSATSKSNISLGKVSGLITISYDLYVVNDDNKSTLALTVGSQEKTGKASTSSSGEFLRFKTTGSDSKTFEFRGGDKSKTSSTKKGEYQTGEWMTLKAVIDTEQSSFSVYKNDELLGENMPLSCKTTDINFDSIDNFSFLTGSKDTTEVYIDNIKVSVEENESEDNDDNTPIPESEKSPADLKTVDFVEDGWKIQLPIESDIKTGSVKEKKPQELADGYSDEFFYVAKDANGNEAILFHCPVDGFKTGNTTYARSELREMLDPNDTSVNWEYYGTHTLTAEQAVTHVPASGKVITSQIHGIEANGDNANPLVKVQYYYDSKKKSGSVNVYLKETTAKTSADKVYTFPNVALGQKYKTEIQVVDGSVYVTISTIGDDNLERSETYSYDFVDADPMWKDTYYYFKLGNYIQDSSDTSSDAYADVWLYNSDISHTKEVDKVKVESIITSESISLKPGEKTTIKVEIYPVKAYNKDVTWSVVSGSDIVTIDKYGYIIAKKEGNAIVRATSVDNPSVTADSQVVVVDSEDEEAKLIYATDFKNDDNLSINNDFDSDVMDVNVVDNDYSMVSLKNEADNNMISIVDNLDNQPAKVSFVFDKQYQTTTIKFKLRIDSLGSHKSTSVDCGKLYAVAAGSDSWYSKANELFRVRNDAKGSIDNYSDLTYVLTSSYDPISLNEDKIIGDYKDWVEMTYIITPNDKSANANTTDIYMNDYLVGENIANSNDIDYVNRLDIQSGTTDIISFSIDDVSIYQGAKVPATKYSKNPKELVLGNLPTKIGLLDSFQVTTEVLPSGSNNEVKYSVVKGDSIVLSANGYLTAEKEGISTIRVESAIDSSIYKEFSIEVINDKDMIWVDNLKFTHESINLYLNDEAKLDTTISPSNASEKALKYQIISGNDVIDLSQDGKIIGLKVGTAKVLVTSINNPECYDYINISVTNNFEKGEIIFQDLFDDKLNNDYWSTSLAKDHTFVNVDNGIMEIIDANNANQPKVQLQFAPTTGLITMQFKIKVNNEVEIQSGLMDTEYKNIRLAFGSGTITSTSNEAFCIRSNGSYFTYGTGGSNYQEIIGDYDISKWNEISLVTNINIDGNDKTSIYINGKKLVEDANNKVDYSIIDKMCFSADTKKYSAYDIDDLTIWVGDYNDINNTNVDDTQTDTSNSDTSNSDTSKDTNKSGDSNVNDLEIVSPIDNSMSSNEFDNISSKNSSNNESISNDKIEDDDTSEVVSEKDNKDSDTNKDEVIVNNNDNQNDENQKSDDEKIEIIEENSNSEEGFQTSTIIFGVIILAVLATIVTLFIKKNKQ